MKLRKSLKTLILVVACCVLATAGITAQASAINARYANTNKAEITSASHMEIL